MTTEWIFEDNLRPFLISLGWFVGHVFDESDWIAIRHGIENAHQEQDSWYGFEFAGNSSARFELASDPGTSVIQ